VKEVWQQIIQLVEGVVVNKQYQYTSEDNFI